METSDIDPENVEANFKRQVTIADDELKVMEEKCFREWMDTMIAGIVSFAERCNTQIRDQRLELKNNGRYAIPTYNRRKRHISKWRKDWLTAEIQEWIGKLNEIGKVRCKFNFAYLASLLMRDKWVNLVSIVKSRAEGWKRSTNS